MKVGTSGVLVGPSGESVTPFGESVGPLLDKWSLWLVSSPSGESVAFP